MTDTQFRIQINHFFLYEPTLTQKNVLEELEHFTLSGEEHSLFILRGYAGTGKSSLIGAYARTLVSLGINVVLMAPTGRAAKVLQGYCGMPAGTIHRTIYRERVLSDGEAIFEKGFNALRTGTFFIIDEASMISNVSDGLSPFGSGRLLDDLIDYCFATRDAKVLLIGDDAQLPPVGTDLSPALDPQYMAHFTPHLYTGLLTDIVRQEEAGEIVQLSYLLRQRILDLAQGGIWHSPLLPRPKEGGDVTIVTGTELPELVEDAYFKVGQEETVLVTRSNKYAEEFNRAIRRQSLDYDDEVENGEMILVCRNNYLHVPKDSNGKPVAGFVANGELLKVVRSRRERSLYGFTFRDAELIDSEGNLIEAPIILESLFSGAAALTAEQRQLLFDNVCLDYPNVTSKRLLYRELRNNELLNALQIKYAYAMTCHKAQGGQWRDVFLHFGYLTEEMIDINFCRWLYTAMTRATDHLYILHPPKFIFGDED